MPSARPRPSRRWPWPLGAAGALCGPHGQASHAAQAARCRSPPARRVRAGAVAGAPRGAAGARAAGARAGAGTGAGATQSGQHGRHARPVAPHARGAADHRVRHDAPEAGGGARERDHEVNKLAVRGVDRGAERPAQGSRRPALHRFCPLRSPSPSVPTPTGMT